MVRGRHRVLPVRLRTAEVVLVVAGRKPDLESRRTHVLYVRVHERELRALQLAAEVDGKPVTTWLRDAGLEATGLILATSDE